MPPPPRRTPPPIPVDPVRIVVALVVLTGACFVALLARDHDDDEPAAAAQALLDDAGPDDDAIKVVRVDAGSVDELARKLEERPVTTKKGRLLKSELQKRAADQKRLASARGTLANAPRAPQPDPLTVVLAGEVQFARDFSRALRGVHVVGAGGRYMVTLRADGNDARSGVSVRCHAAMSELPQRKLVAALSSRADGALERGVDRRSLRREVESACLTALADDVGSWVRAQR